MTLYRVTRAEVDLDAIVGNARTMDDLAGDAVLCAVVKANAYGHGAIAVSRALEQAGVKWLAVATVEEATSLRQARVDVPRILVLSEPPSGSERTIAEERITSTVYSTDCVDRVARAAAARQRVLALHLKVDTGMHRVGCRPDEAVAIADHIAAAPSVQLEGVWTHCARADEEDPTFTDQQLDRFDAVLVDLAEAGHRPPLIHAANSAGVIAHRRSHYGMVRSGIALYGVAPSPDLAGRPELEPAMRLVSEVSHVHAHGAGEGVSYGHFQSTKGDSTLATVPIGYADGVRRDLSARGGEVLIRGHRHPIIGRVTMDQLIVDCLSHQVEPGDEVVLLGSQGDQTISAEEIAGRLDTIGYEVLCAVSARVPRVYE
jgi:alanine racemase